MALKLIVSTDGASRGNPGPSGAGALIEDSSGRTLKELREHLGVTTNNEAEYRAAILGLEAARELGAAEVELRADSELLIRQLEGIYRVKAGHLKPLWEEARRIIESFARVRLRHVPREQNRHADRLSNEAIDREGARGEPDSLTPRARYLLEEALTLPDEERAALADRLAASLTPRSTST